MRSLSAFLLSFAVTSMACAPVDDTAPELEPVPARRPVPTMPSTLPTAQELSSSPREDVRAEVAALRVDSDRWVASDETYARTAAPIAAQTIPFVDVDGAAWIESVVGGEDDNGAGHHELVTLRAGAKEPTRTAIAGVAQRVCTIAGLHHVTGTMDGAPFHVVVDGAGVVTRQPAVDGSIDAVFALDGEAHLLLGLDGDTMTTRLQDLDGNVVVDGLVAPWHQHDVQRGQGALWSGLGERIDDDDVHSFPIAFDDPTRGPLGLVVTDDAVICLEALPGGGDKSVLRRYVRAG